MQPYDTEEQVMGRVPVQLCGAEEVVMARAYGHERMGERWRDGRGMRRGGGPTAPILQPCDAEAMMDQAGGDRATVHYLDMRRYSGLHHLISLVRDVHE
mgnify:CR=1 FL=1